MGWESLPPQPVTVTIDDKMAIPAAIGVQMTLELLDSRFWAIAKQPNDTDCSRVDGACPLDCESMVINCYIVDSNGFILITKEKKDVGKFLGELEGAVMTQLLRMGMFKRISLYDYQAMCKNPNHHANSARPLLSPFYGLASALKWFLSKFLLFLLEFNVCGLWHSDHLAEAKSVFHSSHKHKKVELMQPCDTEYPSFIHDPSIKETNSYIQCARCQKMFVLQQITNSNLLMVVIQSDCDCSRKYSPITLEPKEVKYILPQADGPGAQRHYTNQFLNPWTHNASVKCDRMRSQKIRRRPDSCHAFHPEENAKDCGGASELSLSVALFLASLATSTLVLR
ncbi:hypothetical protein SKAU_G00027910 [Synaphobranchus kaupii]|uniref:Voltage-dependent calcium channel alpha-2/delta subunit conserved region domain-containing protein n=1 Tax=Synaphobranchus kaupii TaxID=118154 RepID=A0A9Q1GE35_SYNKA|nr:hypothetical protein SKAU_G00027910 [Synaphobranchus kaupii]